MQSVGVIQCTGCSVFRPEHCIPVSGYDYVFFLCCGFFEYVLAVGVYAPADVHVLWTVDCDHLQRIAAWCGDAYVPHVARQLGWDRSGFRAMAAKALRYSDHDPGASCAGIWVVRAVAHERPVWFECGFDTRHGFAVVSAELCFCQYHNVGFVCLYGMRHGFNVAL